MATNPRPTVTIRDFLTDKHGFTLPASRLHSYEGTLKHTSSSLFRHPKAFTVHLHASVHENDCETPLEQDRWERGEYFKEGQTTLWAHFVRVPGVDLFGESIEKDNLNREQNLVRTRSKHEHGRRAKKLREKIEERPKKKTDVLQVAYSLPPPNSSTHAYFSQYTEIAPLPRIDAGGGTNRVSSARPFPGFRRSAASNASGAPQSVATQSVVPGNCGRMAPSESPLFEPEVRVKLELSPGWSDDEGGLEWDDDGCC